MNRTLLTLALVTAVVAAPVALAMPGHGNGNGQSGATTTSPPDHSGATPMSPPGRSGAAVVSFVLRGTVNAAPTGGSFTVTLKGTNAHARKSLKGATSFVVLTDANTRFSKAGVGTATFADIAANDRVVVMIRAMRSTDATNLALVAAKRVVDQGQKSA